ncbi:Las1-domain-containing protein [Sporormia fimetaria CBS 119925]|uniref:Las1-domain-containing protein n=1 Tax=Sporormia fimetaria CBS 119925 TaxID=1340428 RepID=A0A6A6V676_9PLEO|nr:Las1-domain-containing protein [Sporormia fimetaria CBS 119925]
MPDLTFVVTPWRNGDELLELRTWFYDRDGEGGDRRRSAVDKVLAWRARKPDIPLLLDSTADLVHAVLMDEEGMEMESLRMVYAAALARFTTGFSDTQLDLRRSRPSWLHSHQQPPNSTTPFLDFPPDILETRHNIVHRHLPPLSVLKSSTQRALKWLWTWYWSHLSHALSSISPPNSSTVIQNPSSTATNADMKESRSSVQKILKSYLRARKSELLAYSQPSFTADTKKIVDEAPSARSAISALSTLPASPAALRGILIDLLIHDTQILPQANVNTRQTLSRKTRIEPSEEKNYHGAFLIWIPLLFALDSSTPVFVSFQDTLTAMLDSAGSGVEGMSDWIVKLVFGQSTIKMWKDRGLGNGMSLPEWVVQECLTRATEGALGVAEEVAKRLGPVWNGDLWRELVGVARGEMESTQGGRVEVGGEDGEQMEVDEDAGDMTAEKADKGKKGEQQKWSGPQRYVGLWRPKGIGVLEEGWEVDE